MKWVTDAKKGFSYYTKHGNYVEVPENELKSSGGIVLSRDFFPCHLLAFMDSKKKAAMAHLSSTAFPEDVIDGWEGTSFEGGHEKLADIYANPDDVNVLHVYHKNINNLSIRVFEQYAIDEMLNKRGFNDARHVPLYNESGHSPMRDAVIDNKDGCLYIFPITEKCYFSIPFF